MSRLTDCFYPIRYELISGYFAEWPFHNADYIPVMRSWEIFGLGYVYTSRLLSSHEIVDIAPGEDVRLRDTEFAKEARKKILAAKGKINPDDIHKNEEAQAGLSASRTNCVFQYDIQV